MSREDYVEDGHIVFYSQYDGCEKTYRKFIGNKEEREIFLEHMNLLGWSLKEMTMSIINGKINDHWDCEFWRPIKTDVSYYY